MSRYAVGIVACLWFVLDYCFFRYEVFESLRERGIRKRDLRHRMKGVRGFWCLAEIDRAYGLPWGARLATAYAVVYPTVTAYHLALGWRKALPYVDVGALTVLCLLTSCLLLYTCISRNRRHFARSFVLFGTRKQTDRRGKHLSTSYDSVLFDFIMIAHPAVFVYLLIVFTVQGW